MGLFGLRQTEREIERKGRKGRHVERKREWRRNGMCPLQNTLKIKTN